MHKPHELIGWDLGWAGFCKALKGVHRSHPEWLALTHYLVASTVSNHTVKTKPPLARPLVVPDVVPDVVAIPPGGVLFVPIFNRSYCLDVCYRLAKTLKEISPEVPAHFLIPDGEISPLMWNDSEIIWHPKTLLRKFTLAPNQWFRCAISWLKATRALNQNTKTRQALRVKFGFWPVALFKVTAVYYWEIGAAKQWLKKNKIKAVVTINDVVKPAAPLIAAANQLGLETIVLQHGTPGPQSAPFLAKRSWVWGETSKKLLQGFGASPDLIEIIGNLEIDHSNYDVPAGVKSGVNDLLILSQWCGSVDWSDDEFQKLFELAAEAAKKDKRDWRLVIRLHPNDRWEVREQIIKKIEPYGLLYQFSSVGRRIEEDVARSAFVCCIHSSGIMHAIAAKIPCAAVISERLEKRLGTSLLHSRQIARNATMLSELLSDSSLLTDEERDKVIANYGHAYKKAARALASLAN